MAPLWMFLTSNWKLSWLVDSRFVLFEQSTVKLEKVWLKMLQTSKMSAPSEKVKYNMSSIYIRKFQITNTINLAIWFPLVEERWIFVLMRNIEGNQGWILMRFDLRQIFKFIGKVIIYCRFYRSMWTWLILVLPWYLIWYLHGCPLSPLSWAAASHLTLPSLTPTKLKLEQSV